MVTAQKLLALVYDHARIATLATAVQPHPGQNRVGAWPRGLRKNRTCPPPASLSAASTSGVDKPSSQAWARRSTSRISGWLTAPGRSANPAERTFPCARCTKTPATGLPSRRYGSAATARPRDGHILHGVAKAFPLLVRRIMLLVDDNHAWPGHRRPGRPNRVPTIMCAAPLAASLQEARRSPSDRPECRIARFPSKRLLTLSSNWGVRPISGTRNNTWRPAADLLHGFEIHFGFPATGNAKQQGRQDLRRP